MRICRGDERHHAVGGNCIYVVITRRTLAGRITHISQAGKIYCDFLTVQILEFVANRLCTMHYALLKVREHIGDDIDAAYIMVCSALLHEVGVYVSGRHMVSGRTRVVDRLAMVLFEFYPFGGLFVCEFLAQGILFITYPYSQSGIPEIV